MQNYNVMGQSNVFILSFSLLFAEYCILNLLANLKHFGLVEYNFTRITLFNHPFNS